MELPLAKDEVRDVYYNFRSTRPFAYHNRTILGCFADPLNLYCEFYNPRDNSSSLFTIDGVMPF